MAEIKLVLKVDDQGTIVLDKFTSQIKKTGDSVSSMDRALSVVKWDAFTNLVQKAYGVLSKFYDLAERGAKVRAVEESFTSMARNFNVAGDALIRELERVTKGTVENSDLMAKALRLISEGFSEKQIVGIGEAARVSARLTGKTVSEAYEAISDSIINLRERGLKTAGIVIDMDKAYQKHAITLGVGKEQLSDYGKRMAIVDTVMEKTEEDSAKLGKSLNELNDYEQFQKRSAVWKEMGDQVAKLAGEFVKLSAAAVRAWADVEKGAREWAGMKLLQGLGALGLMPTLPSNYYLSEKLTTGLGMMAGAAKGGPSQIKVADPLEVQKKLLELQKQGLAIGYQTFEDKIKILDLDRESAIQELKKVGMRQLASKVWENYWKNVAKAEAEEADRISGINVAFGKVVAEAQRLSDLGEMPSWEDFLIDIPKGMMVIETETGKILVKFSAYADMLDRVRESTAEIMRLNSEWMKGGGFERFGYEAGDFTIPQDYMKIGEKLQKIYDPKIAKEMELEVAKITYDYQAQYEIGLKLIEMQADQYNQLGLSDATIEKWKSAKTFQLNVELGRTVDLTKSIGDAFNKVFDGMIAGTLKVKDAFKSFFLSIGRDYLNVFLKNTREGLEKWVNNLFSGKTTTASTNQAGQTTGTSGTSGGGGGILGWLGLGGQMGSGGGGGGGAGSLLGAIAAVYSIASIYSASGSNKQSRGSSAGSGFYSGAILGTTIGSYFPILGNIVGFIVGGIVGAVAGWLGGGSGEDAKKRMIAALAQRNKTYGSMVAMGFDIPINEKGTGFDMSAIKEQGGLLGIPAPHVGKKRTALWEAAQELYKSVAEDFAKALSAGLRIDSFKTFERGLRNSIYENVLEGMVQAFTRASALREVLTPIYQFIYEGVANALTKGFDIAGFKAGIEERYAKLTPVLAAMEPLFKIMYQATQSLRGEITGGGGRLSIPSFQHGGVMPYTGLALVHKNEPVGAPPVTVNINNPSFGDTGGNIDILSYRIGRKIQWATKRPQVFG